MNEQHGTAWGWWLDLANLDGVRWREGGRRPRLVSSPRKRVLLSSRAIRCDDDTVRRDLRRRNERIFPSSHGDDVLNNATIRRIEHGGADFGTQTPLPFLERGHR